MDGYNRYYQHFLNQSGRGEFTIPELGEIYHYKTALRRGNGHLFNSRIRYRRGLGFGTILSSLYQRAKPLLRVLGTKAVNVISNIAKDTLSGKNFKDATIKNISQALPPGIAAFIPPNLGEREPVITSVSPSDLIKTQRLRRLQRKRKGRGLEEQYPGLQFL
jgi:hypothetical protein